MAYDLGLHCLLRLVCPILRLNMMCKLGKRSLCHMHTANVQINLHTHAVWSGHSLSVNIYYSIHSFCKQTMKAQISLHGCAGWSGPSVSANCIRALFVHCASYGIWLREKGTLSKIVFASLLKGVYMWERIIFFQSRSLSERIPFRTGFVYRKVKNGGKKVYPVSLNFSNSTFILLNKLRFHAHF